jgi:ATP-dependent protease ClpP protease subunit
MKEVLIDDVIGYDWWTDSGITAKSVQKQLKGIEAGEDIKVIIDSPGGSVYDGIVIFNLLRDYAKSHPVSVRINCIAMSMAAYIALAPRTVDKNAKITASDNSVFMIHNPWGIAYGDYRDFKKTLNTLKNYPPCMARCAPPYRENQKKKSARLWIMKRTMLEKKSPTPATRMILKQSLKPKMKARLTEYPPMPAII